MSRLVYCPGVCRECGCRDEAPCEAGCTWVQDDLCSACADAMGGDEGDELAGEAEDLFGP